MKREGLFTGSFGRMRAGRYALICSSALEDLRGTYNSIACVNCDTDEYVCVMNVEAPTDAKRKIYSWSQLRDNALTTVAEEDRENFRFYTSPDHFRRVCEKGMESDTFTYRCKKNNLMCFMQMMIVPARDEKMQNMVFLYVKKLDESTAAGELHKEQLWNQMRSAQAGENKKDQYLKYFSKGMKVPLDAVIGLSALAKEALEAGDLEKTQKYLSIIAGTQKCARMMLDDIVQVSVRGEQKLSTRQNKFSLRNLLDGYRIFYEKVRMWDKDISFAMDIDDRLREEYYGDDSRLIQVLNELLTNAYQFSRSGDKVTLKVTLLEAGEDRDLVEFIVSDNGFGISEEYAPHLFVPFTMETKRDYGIRKGSGMGLVLVKMEVEALEGTIRVESAEDCGTSFRIVLPLRKLTEEKEFQLTPCRVLVVDDNELNRNIVVEILRMHGWVSDAYEHGAVALEAFEQSTPGTYDIVLTDLKMPVMDGYRLAREIRDSKHPDAKTVRIIGISACFDKEQYQETKAFDGYLLKPFRMEEFVELCGNIHFVKES